MRLFLYAWGFAMAVAVCLSGTARAVEDAFEIQVVDQQTRRGVPLVELETVNNVRHITDSNGLVALSDPGLFGQRVFFFVRSHGYEFTKDGFGFRGQAVDVVSGGSVTLQIKRINVAQRLYRMTGEGIYRDSVLLNREVPIEHPLLNAKVFGSDSVVNAVYRGKIHWFWGDTHQPAYPLGNFHVPGAVSELPTAGGLDPDAGVNLSYYTGENGFARPVAKMPGEGPTWIDGLVTLTDKDGSERMFAAYVKIKPPLSVYRRGLVEWNDQTQRFDQVVDFRLDAPVHPGGHPVKHREGDVEHVYFAKPYPLVRVPATPDSLARLDDYEAFTCLLEGTGLDDPKLDRDSGGMLRYAWKRNTPPLDSQSQQMLVESGQMKASEALLALRDRDTGKPIFAHGGSVYWNKFRQRWVMVFLEKFGSPSLLGEVWFAEADTLVGPWVYATKIVSHDRYDFYNPKQHPMFDANGGRTIYFEGTYTNTFSGNPIKTPRYEYNQVMYKLDLTDPRLALPVAVYRTDDGRLVRRSTADNVQPERVAFFALDRAVEGAVPVYATDNGLRLATTAPYVSDEQSPAFYGLPADATEPPDSSRPLYEFVHSSTKTRIYATDENAPGGQYQRQAKPICRVWQNSLRFAWKAVKL